MTTGSQGARRCTRKVHSIFNKLPSSLRLSNVIGRGMPERIRSMGFAFLGLTAAAGLAVVAIFAQMGFPLLSPVPLPNGGSSEPSSVSKAVPVEEGSAKVGLLARDQGVAAAPSASRGQGGGGAATRDERGANVDRSATAVSDAPSGDSPGGSEPVTTSPPTATDPAPEPAPTTTTTTESTPPPDEVPVSSPDTDSKPGKSTAVSSKPDKDDAKPAAKPAKSKPASSAKTKSAKPAKEAKPAATPAPAASSVPAPAPAAVGQDKEEKAQEEKKDK